MGEVFRPRLCAAAETEVLYYLCSGVDDDGHGCVNICAEEQQAALVPQDPLQQMQGCKVCIFSNLM